MAAKNARENPAFCRASFVANSHSDSILRRNFDKKCIAQGRLSVRRIVSPPALAAMQYGLSYWRNRVLLLLIREL